MFIKDILKKDRINISFEVFPPKRTDDIAILYKAIEELKEINPDFVSVTYGAGGSTRDKTVEISNYIKNDLDLVTMSHLTCVNSTKDDIEEVLKQLKDKGIDNILALRGDPPAGQESFTVTDGGFRYASELISFIKSKYDFSIGVAGYPEGHTEASSIEADIKNLKIKADSGADFIITQLFFNNDDFFRFMDLCDKNNISIPVLPGIMPILNYKSVMKITSLCGAKIPLKLAEQIEKYKDSPEEVEKIGTEYALNQINDLIQQKVCGIHFYGMNKSRIIKDIYNSIKNKL